MRNKITARERKARKIREMVIQLQKDPVAMKQARKLIEAC